MALIIIPKVSLRTTWSKENKDYINKQYSMEEYTYSYIIDAVTFKRWKLT